MIRIHGAREHNLRNISVDIPDHRLTVITGLSGSGKSTLAFDTLFAEGQRRYVESLSVYARQFLHQLHRPDVDSVDGLPPAIAIGQRAFSGANPRSTVATATELMDYLRVLFSIAATPHCPHCGRPVGSSSAEQIVESLLALPDRSRLTLLAPLARATPCDIAPLADAARAAGFVRLRVDGTLHELDALPTFPANAPHTVEVVVDRLVLKEGIRSRLTDSIELSLRHGKGLLTVAWTDPDPHEQTFSEQNLCPDCGLVFDRLDAASFSFNHPRGSCPTCSGLGHTDSATPCPDCHGNRLRPEPLAARLPASPTPIGIAPLLQSTLRDALAFFSAWTPPPDRAPALSRVLSELRDRLHFLNRVGVGYLTLNRECATLSGGEAQRIRLATQIGSSLVGVLYVLDEPSVGLHPRDTARLLDSLRELRDRGNTVVVVEHDADIIRAADHIIDMGPGAGRLGGSVLFSGPLPALLSSPDSITARYLHDTAPTLPTPHPLSGSITLPNASIHNLQNLSVSIPLHGLVAVTGVSGSGKSTLVHDVLIPTVEATLKRPSRFPSRTPSRDPSHIDKLIVIDQSPIGRTPRSNPATYTGILDDIRELLAQTPVARARGYTAARFSFNAKGGRCEVCKGEGEQHLEMNFLPDAAIPCPQCGGLRFNRETLEVRYAGRSIADILALTVDDALPLFAPYPRLRRALESLRDVGLGYLQLGQSAATLSGGEAQRVKLAAELQRPAEHHTLYVLDEPTTGLHFADVERLLSILQRLRDNGHSIVVVEHNLDVIRASDWILDLGPGGGDEGGTLVASGTPADVARCPDSFTGAALREVLP